MGLVKVWNRNSFQFRDTYKDEVITIKPGGYHEMDRDEAVFFLGMPPSKIELDVNEMPLPECNKNLWIDPGELYGKGAQVSAKVAAQAHKFICQADGSEFGTQIEDPKVQADVIAGKAKTDEELARLVRGGGAEPLQAKGRPTGRGVNEAASRRIEQANVGD